VLPKAIAKVRIWWLNLSRGTKELKSWQEINSSYLMAEKRVVDLGEAGGLVARK